MLSGFIKGKRIDRLHRYRRNQAIQHEEKPSHYALGLFRIGVTLQTKHTRRHDKLL